MGAFLEDEFDENPKVVLAGEKAAWMYVRGLLYCRRNPKTGGRIPKPKVRELTKLVADPRQLAKRLVEVGLWEDDGGDFFHVHDWEVHNQSAEVRRVELDVQQEARREHARKAANARHHGHKSGTNEQGSGIDRASVEHEASNARAMPEQCPSNASRGRGRAPDPGPNPTAQSPPEDSVGVPNGSSMSAHGHAQPDAQAVLANGFEKEMDRGKPQVNDTADPEAERWLDLWPVRKLDEARAALALCRKHIDERIIGEAIGHCVDMKPRPKSPRYLCKIATDWAQDRGANLNDAEVAELLGEAG